MSVSIICGVLHCITILSLRATGKAARDHFDDQEYFNTMKNTWVMEKLVTRHSTIMDKYDPDKNQPLRRGRMGYLDGT